MQPRDVVLVPLEQPHLAVPDWAKEQPPEAVPSLLKWPNLAAQNPAQPEQPLLAVSMQAPEQPQSAVPAPKAQPHLAVSLRAAEQPLDAVPSPMKQPPEAVPSLLEWPHLAVHNPAQSEQPLLAVPMQAPEQPQSAVLAPKAQPRLAVPLRAAEQPRDAVPSPMEQPPEAVPFSPRPAVFSSSRRCWMPAAHLRHPRVVQARDSARLAHLPPGGPGDPLLDPLHCLKSAHPSLRGPCAPFFFAVSPAPRGSRVYHVTELALRRFFAGEPPSGPPSLP